MSQRVGRGPIPAPHALVPSIAFVNSLDRHGAAHALSSDVRLGPPGLGSLHVRFAAPSMAALAPI